MKPMHLFVSHPSRDKLMANNTLTYSGNSFTEYLESLAVLFGVEIADNTIKIPPSAGKGLIKFIELEEGFGLRYYDFVLHTDLDLNIFYDDDQELIYRVLYMLPEDAAFPASNKNFIVMYTGEGQAKGYIKREEHFCRIAIVFNSAWLENNYHEANTNIEELTRSLVVNNMPVIISKELDHRSHILSVQLAKGIRNNSLPLIEVKLICIILMNKFLHKIMEAGDPKILSGESSHYETILKVERKISNSLTKPLPPLQQVAKEFNLSPSTLQRHFKMVFGKNIFEYYQEKRMLWGRREIENGNKSISQVAYELGFIKVNNFSKAFRKQFNLLPRELKLKNITL